MRTPFPPHATRRPYGVYVCGDHDHVLFDRNYAPIARFQGGPDSPALIIPAAHRDRPVVLPLGKVTPLSPDLWIDHRDKAWLYDDSCSPRVNRATRARVNDLIRVLSAFGVILPEIRRV